MTDDQLIGIALSSERVQRNLRLWQVAEAMGISISTVHGIEKGKRALRVREIIPLSQLFGMTKTGLAAALFGE